MKMRSSAFLSVLLSATPALAEPNQQAPVQQSVPLAQESVPLESRQEPGQPEAVQQTQAAAEPAAAAQQAEQPARPARVRRSAASLKRIAARAERIENLAATIRESEYGPQAAPAEAQPQAQVAPSAAAPAQAVPPTHVQAQAQAAVPVTAAVAQANAAPPETPSALEEAAYVRGWQDARADMLVILRALAMDTDAARRVAESIAFDLAQHPDLAETRRDADLVVEILRKQQAGEAAQMEQLRE